MDYKVLSAPVPMSAGKVRKHNPAVVLLHFCCLGLVGFIFAIGCFVLFISGLILDFLAFLGLLGVALGSLIWGRVKRVEGPMVVRRLIEYFSRPVWK